MCLLSLRGRRPWQSSIEVVLNIVAGLLRCARNDGKLIFCLLLISTSIWAMPIPAESLISRLQAITTLQAQFTEKIYNSEGELVQQGSGKLALQRPKNFRWQTNKPTEQLIVTNGKKLWVYDIDLEQVTEKNLNSTITSAPLFALLSNPEQLRSNYHITVMIPGQAFRLEPKNAASQFHHVELHFAGKALQQILLHSRSDQKTKIKLSHAVLNQPVASKLFQFSAPAGVDIIK